MRYEFIRLQDAGNHGDDILHLQQVPTWYEESIGFRRRELVFVGHDDQWHTMTGLPVRVQLRECLESAWSNARQQGKLENPQPPRNWLPNEQQDQEAKTEVDQKIDESSEESFPASDPPSWTPVTGS